MESSVRRPSLPNTYSYVQDKHVIYNVARKGGMQKGDPEAMVTQPTRDWYSVCLPVSLSVCNIQERLQIKRVFYLEE